MAKEGLNVNLEGETIVYTTISKSNNGYNYAEALSKVSNDIYISVRVEWKDDQPIPGFAMDLMEYMQSNADELAVKAATYKEEIAKFIKN